MNVFDKAIGVLRERGWNDYTLEADDGSVCVSGALIVALFGEDWAYTEPEFDTSPRFIGACQALARLVLPSEPPDMEAVMQWNHIARDVDEVIFGLKLASEAHDAGIGSSHACETL